MNSTTLYLNQGPEYSGQPFLNKKAETDEQTRLALPHSKYYVYAYNASKIAKYCNEKPELLEKLIKNAHRFLEILAKVQLVINPRLIALAEYLKNAAEVLESLRFINTFKLIVRPTKRSKSFLLDPHFTFRRKSSYIMLFGHTACNTLKALHKWQLIDLGAIAKWKVGPHLTHFHLVTDGLMIGSCFLKLWDDSVYFRKKNARLKVLNGYNEIIAQLEARTLSQRAVLSRDEEEVIACVRKKQRKLSRDLTHNIIRVASAASKIFVLALGLLFTAASMTTTIPLVILLACGFIADSIGLVKIYSLSTLRLMNLSIK